MSEKLYMPDAIRQLEKAWSTDTSALPQQWSQQNISRGQCAVTALVWQDLFGGELMRTTVKGESHYLNRIGGELVDVTFDQFPRGSKYDSEPEERSRQYVLAFASTRKRYATLVNRMWA